MEIALPPVGINPLVLGRKDGVARYVNPLLLHGFHIVTSTASYVFIFSVCLLLGSI